VGRLADGSGHAFGVVLPNRGERLADGQEVIDVVVATGWAQYADEDGGVHLVLSDPDANIVARYAPGEWVDVLNELPGLDEEPEES
jgi:hypothetical protein